MWIKITKEEKEKMHKKRASAYFLFAIPFIIILSYLAKNGYNRLALPQEPISWTATAIWFLFFLIVATSFYFGKVASSKNGYNSDTYICTKCWEIREARSENDKCACGGDYDYLDNYKYKKDE